MRDLCPENILNVQYVQTADMGADIMTKPLYRGKFKVDRENVGVLQIPKDETQAEI